ncbi:MAG: porin [Leptothrix sp. (in: b-proteobacteria)]
MKNTLNAQTKLLIGSAALLLAGAAQAETTFYGLVDLSVGKNEISTPDKRVDFHSGGDNGSSEGNSTTKLGVKGNTDVAPGLKANFQFETGGIGSDGKVNADGTFFNRQAWAGVSGNLGEVRFGKQDSVAFQTQAGFDFNGASNAATALGNSGVGPWLPNRQAKSLQYLAPTVGALKTQFGVQLAGDVPNAKNTYSLGATYTVGPLAVGVAGETKRTITGESFKSIAASYDLGIVKGMASYADGGDIANGGSGKGFGLGLTAPVAGYTVGLIYGDNSDTKVKAIEAFVNREVFKNTTVYFDFGNKWEPTKATKFAYALGAIYAF